MVGREDDLCAGAVGSQDTSRVTVSAGGRQKATTGMGNKMKDLQETWELARRSKWRPRNNREADRSGGNSGKEQMLVEKGGCWLKH